MVPPLVALDIGSTKIACAIGQPHEHPSGFELLGSSLVPYPVLSEAWLSDPLMVSQAIEQALEATAVEADCQRALVAISPPTLVSESVRVSLALGDEPVAIRSQDLDRLQMSALDRVLGVDRESLVVERLGCAGNGFEKVRDPRGLPATRLLADFHVVTMPAAARRAAVQAVESAGLEMVRLTSSLPAALAGMGDDHLLQQRVLLMDVGGLSTRIGLFVEGAFWSFATLPWGGLTLAMRLAANFRVTLDQALAWSLEGIFCRKPGVREEMERQWESLPPVIQKITAGQPRPDIVLLSGRGALIDGFAEWVERIDEVKTALCRSPRTSRGGDVSRQVGLNPAIGLLELAARENSPVLQRPPYFFDRLIHQARTLLTEYF